MRSLGVIALGLLLWQTAAPAQTNNFTDTPAADPSADTKSGVIGTPVSAKREFTPLTASERWRLYFMSTFGPAAIARSAAVSGINQWTNTPKEWRCGAEAYGERFGSTFATHIIKKTIEGGAAAALHEDNRYIPCPDSGFFKRARYAVTSVFVARNNAGAEHFAYSRFGGAASAAFISRIWQPHSTNTAGDGAVNFGFNIAADMGWNVFKEFRPHRHPKE